MYGRTTPQPDRRSTTMRQTKACCMALFLFPYRPWKVFSKEAAFKLTIGAFYWKL
jgi:hypothetical protein